MPFAVKIPLQTFCIHHSAFIIPLQEPALLTKTSLTTDLLALGMTSGDTIFVHSAYSTLSRAPGGVDGGPQTVIDAILAIGAQTNP